MSNFFSRDTEWPAMHPHYNEDRGCGGHRQENEERDEEELYVDPRWAQHKDAYYAWKRSAASPVAPSCGGSRRPLNLETVALDANIMEPLFGRARSPYAGRACEKFHAHHDHHHRGVDYDDESHGNETPRSPYLCPEEAARAQWRDEFDRHDSVYAAAYGMRRDAKRAWESFKSEDYSRRDREAMKRLIEAREAARHTEAFRKKQRRATLIQTLATGGGALVGTALCGPPCGALGGGLGAIGGEIAAPTPGQRMSWQSLGRKAAFGAAAGGVAPLLLPAWPAGLAAGVGGGLTGWLNAST